MYRCGFRKYFKYPATPEKRQGQCKGRDETCLSLGDPASLVNRIRIARINDAAEIKAEKETLLGGEEGQLLPKSRNGTFRKTDRCIVTSSLCLDPLCQTFCTLIIAASRPLYNAVPYFVYSLLGWLACFSANGFARQLTKPELFTWNWRFVDSVNWSFSCKYSTT